MWGTSFEARGKAFIKFRFPLGDLSYQSRVSLDALLLQTWNANTESLFVLSVLTSPWRSLQERNNFICNILVYRTTNNGEKKHFNRCTLRQLPCRRNNNHAIEREMTDSVCSVTVELLNPNQHKVCVIYSGLVLIWRHQTFRRMDLTRRFQHCVGRMVFTTISMMLHDHHLMVTAMLRLRLLCWDSADHGVFLPHCHATTTTTSTSTTTVMVLPFMVARQRFWIPFLQSSERMLEVVLKFGEFRVFNADFLQSQSSPDSKC